MPSWFLSALAIEVGGWAAMFACLAGRRQRLGDPAGMQTCAHLSGWCLLTGLGFLIWSKGV